MRIALITNVLVLLCLSGQQVQAQSGRDPEDTSTGQLLVQQLSNESGNATEATLLTNQATLQQQGSLNQASIDQHMIGVGRGNAAIISQNGMGNAAAILQNGAGGRVTITQSGANNVAASEVNGYNTESDITQRGNGNRVDQQLNVDERRYSVEQMGNNNNLIQRETGSTTPGYEVTMKGNGIKIIIEQGRVATQP
ncbi:hypothetical protein [Hymenobacter lucidus]|uniref:Curlin n=1 Tax=Hymenobacter lucidus TaxID=2880930 RepID=A0ABS8ARZ3_9BACT|nr:hypothetical protein [Hymenobacter lucidus]MCB2408987.1 hypothetical protein [Hymenobacter lucidus]